VNWRPNGTFDVGINDATAETGEAMLTADAAEFERVTVLVTVTADTVVVWD
jgi:hypothetical protein